jgi:hypothetical protein
VAFCFISINNIK